MGLKEPKVTEQLGKKSDRWTELRGEDSTIQIQGRQTWNEQEKQRFRGGRGGCGVRLVRGSGCGKEQWQMKLEMSLELPDFERRGLGCHVMNIKVHWVKILSESVYLLLF